MIRYRVYSFINIAGLTVGFIASILILLWVLDESSYDRFHVNSDRIYQVIINYTYPDGTIDTYSANPAKLKQALVEEIPEVEMAAQYSMDIELLLKSESSAFNEIGIYSDPQLFDIFSFPFVSGVPSSHENSIVISSQLAAKLFDNADPINKVLSIGGEDFFVSGVFEDIPENSSLKFDFVIPFHTYVSQNPWTQNWQSGGTRTTVLLEDGASVEYSNQKMAGLITKNCSSCSSSPFLFPFVKLRLESKFENGVSAGGRIQQVYLFSAVAILILLIACINFMNLSTARSATRSREVGVRKSIGASRSSLVSQFMIESVFQSFWL